MQDKTAALNSNVVSISSRQTKTLWWETPLDEFVELIQQLHKDHGPYFSKNEMRVVYDEVSQYTLERGKLWDTQVKMGISSEYLQYLADDLTGYLRNIYQVLLQDIMDRKAEKTPAKRKHNEMKARLGGEQIAQVRVLA